MLVLPFQHLFSRYVLFNIVGIFCSSLKMFLRLLSQYLPTILFNYIIYLLVNFPSYIVILEIIYYINISSIGQIEEILILIPLFLNDLLNLLTLRIYVTFIPSHLWYYTYSQITTQTWFSLHHRFLSDACFRLSCFHKLFCIIFISVCMLNLLPTPCNQYFLQLLQQDSDYFTFWNYEM